MIVNSLQSFLVPLQGFLNAIVYGWTREDFTQLMAIGKGHFEGWNIDGTEEESDTAPVAVEESEAQSMHSNIVLNRYNNSYEVENTIVSDEADLN